MSSPAATINARRSGRRSHLGRRRRRFAMMFVAVLIAVVGIPLALPLLRRVLDDLTLPLSYSGVIRQQAAEKHLDPALIAAVIYAETKFDPRPSSAGAQGLMQILPRTAEFLARRSGATTFSVSDLAAPQVNIAYGSYYLRYLLDRYRGQLMLALAAYNGGETNVNRWISRARSEGAPLTVQQIPFPETRAYVERVLQAQQNYRHTYPSQLGYG